MLSFISLSISEIYYLPCWVDKLLVELIVIIGFPEAFGCDSWASLESCRDKENRRELKFATPLVTFATSELKKLILAANTSNVYFIQNSNASNRSLIDIKFHITKMFGKLVHINYLQDARQVQELLWKSLASQKDP